MSKTERALDEALDDAYDVSDDLDVELDEVDLDAEELDVEELGDEAVDAEDEPYELPEIIMATEADDEACRTRRRSVDRAPSAR